MKCVQNVCSVLFNILQLDELLTRQVFLKRSQLEYKLEKVRLYYN